MSYELSSEVTRAIDALLATGKYSSHDEVLRDALNALRQRDEDLAAIAAGIADMEAGRYRSFAVVDSEFRKRHDIAPNDELRGRAH
jgi:putative addiction module CopG family antidote